MLKLRFALLTRSLVCGDDQLQETSKILHDSSWCKYLWAAYLCVCELLQLNQVTSTNAGDLRLGLSFSCQFEAAGPDVSVLQWQSGDSHWDQSIQDEQPATLSAGFEWCTYTSGTNCGTIAILSLHILGKTPSKPNASCYRKAWWMGCASFVGPLDRILPSMYEPQKSGGILQSWQLAWWVDSKLKIFVFFVAVWLQSPTLRSVQQNTYNKSSAMAPMKAMAKSVKVMTKGALATELADAAGLKKGDTTKATGQYRSCVTCCFFSFFLQMLRKYGSNTKKSVTSHLGEGCEGFLACEVWNQVLDLLAEIGTKEVKKTGKFTLPGLCMIKTRKKKVSWWNLHQFFPHSYWKFNMLPTWFSRKSATEATKGTGFRVLASFKSRANPFPFLISLNEAHNQAARRWCLERSHPEFSSIYFNVLDVFCVLWILHNKYAAMQKMQGSEGQASAGEDRGEGILRLCT